MTLCFFSGREIHLEIHSEIHSGICSPCLRGISWELRRGPLEEVLNNEVCCPMTPRLMRGRVPIVSTGAVAQVCVCVGSPGRFSPILGVVSCSGSCFRRSSPAAIALDFKPGKLKPQIGVGPKRAFRASPETMGDRPTDRPRAVQWGQTTLFFLCCFEFRRGVQNIRKCPSSLAGHALLWSCKQHAYVKYRHASPSA